MNVTMDVEGQVWGGTILSDIDWFLDDLELLTRQRYTLPSLEGIGPSGTCMRQRRSRPLTEAHPELLVIDTPGLCREYRVENRQSSPSQQHGRFAGLPWISWTFSVILVGLLWPSVRSFQTLSPPSVTHTC